MDSATSLTGDTAVMHDHHSAAFEYGPIYGPFVVFGAWLLGQVTASPSAIDALDRFFMVGMHGAMFSVAVFGAYKTFAPGATKLWQSLRRR